jgi:hypothetical protein
MQRRKDLEAAQQLPENQRAVCLAKKEKARQQSASRRARAKATVAQVVSAHRVAAHPDGAILLNESDDSVSEVVVRTILLP